MKRTAIVIKVERTGLYSWRGAPLVHVTAKCRSPFAEITVSMCESRARAYWLGREIHVEVTL